MAASSRVDFVVGTETVHKFSPFLLHPWSTGGSLVVIVSVPFLWNVTPSFPGLNMVVYPLSAILFTLMSDLVRPGSMFARLASSDSCSNGSCVALVALNVESSGRYTVRSDGPVTGKLSLSVTKCDVAPESIIMLSLFRCRLISCRLAILLFHLLDFGCCCCLVDFTVFMCSSSVVGSSSSVSLSGVQ